MNIDRKGFKATTIPCPRYRCCGAIIKPDCHLNIIFVSANPVCGIEANPTEPVNIALRPTMRRLLKIGTIIALAIGILLDATVVRCMLLPAFVAVVGRWNWWMPVWAARLP